MFRRGMLAMVASLVLAASAGAQTAPADSASRWVDSIFAPFDSRQSPGCAVAVTRDGAVAFAKGYGMADLEHDTPITADTRFYIASVSKQFTAMSIVLLAQEHRLSLDDPIQKWVPEVPTFGATITLRNLLHHTSGLRDYFTLLAVSGWPSDGPLTEQELLALVARQKSLNFKPGDEFLYSNTGYALLSIVVKRASGESLRDFADERIFRPLGMTHTEFRDDHNALIPQRALGYRPSGSTYRTSEPEFDVVGDGGVYSTVGDLAKWDANFRDARVGGQEGIALMLAPGHLNDGETIPYALGLTLGEFHGLKTVSHGGAYGGYQSEFLRFPDQHISVITLCNTSLASPTLAEQVSTVRLGLASQKPSMAPVDLTVGLLAAGTSELPTEQVKPQRRANEFAPLAGEYYSEELALPVTLIARDGLLVLQRRSADELRFVPLGTDLFTNSDKMLLRVVRSSTGQVTSFTLTINRVRDLVFTREDPGSHTH
ncbi:MAG TPA: serine hydrolase domain-containing protein [Gemmatimonadaceae bacterium]|jgi:CubicO group peptidase (beta-lactamase class C family)